MVEKKRVGKRSGPFPSHCRWARRENKGVGSGVFLAYLHTYIRLRNAKAQHDSKYRGSKEKNKGFVSSAQYASCKRVVFDFLAPLLFFRPAASAKPSHRINK